MRFIGLSVPASWRHGSPAAGTDPKQSGASFQFQDMSKGIGGALTFNFDPHWVFRNTDFRIQLEFGQAASELDMHPRDRGSSGDRYGSVLLHALPGLIESVTTLEESPQRFGWRFWAAA